MHHTHICLQSDVYSDAAQVLCALVDTGAVFTWLVCDSFALEREEERALRG